MKEQHYRSAVKGISWRVLATLDTIFLSWLFTGQIATALKIGGIEVFTKIGLFYLHERLWMLLKFGTVHTRLEDGTVVTRDKHYKSILKGASYRFFGTLDTILIALFITGNYTQAFSIGFAEVFTKIGLYYLHERVWYKIKWGTGPAVPADAAAQLAL
jgi:uncharacterized membrane protein